ncbi:plasmid stabilization protein [Myxococcota bacterium]|nr:plasmid stabilization protein [Myxococcota bacterium]
MASITIRQLGDETKRRLRMRAAQHGRSMEEEAREILRGALAVASAEAVDLGARIRGRMGPLGGVDLDLAPREPIREPPDLG